MIMSLKIKGVCVFIGQSESYNSWTNSEEFHFYQYEDETELDRIAFQLYSQSTNDKTTSVFKEIILKFRKIFPVLEAGLAWEGAGLCQEKFKAELTKLKAEAKEILSQAKINTDLNEDMKECCAKIATAIEELCDIGMK
jgi:hypothetical protein